MFVSWTGLDWFWQIDGISHSFRCMKLTFCFKSNLSFVTFLFWFIWLRNVDSLIGCVVWSVNMSLHKSLDAVNKQMPNSWSWTQQMIECKFLFHVLLLHFLFFAACRCFWFSFPTNICMALLFHNIVAFSLWRKEMNIIHRSAS